MLPKHLKKHIHVLHVLGHCNDKLRKHVIEQSGDGLTKVLCEAVKNSLMSNGCIKHNQHEKGKLRKHKSTFIKLIDKKVPIQKKKKMLIQKGGFLPFIIKPLLRIFLPGVVNALSQ